MEEAAVMPVHGQEFCLRWNNYHTSLSSTLDCFKNDKDFVDVTLACEGKYLMAHKMLLSACSVYFRDLIKVNPCQHPIIILPQEVQFADMEKLLRFIYQGEVNVLQENLSRFLKTAEMFKIRGLAEDNEKQKVLRTCSPSQGSPCPSNSSGGGTAAGECSGTSPKRPRLSLDTTSASSSLANATSTSIINTITSQSITNNALTVTSSSSSSSNNCASATLVLDTPATPNNEDSTHSANDSDSEMLPVKQEMVELKACDDFETDSEPFNPDKYLKEGVVMTTPASASNDSGNSSNNNKQQPPPPPPGPLLPSYIPPPPIKAQEDSPVGGTASDELSQGGMSVRLMSGGGMVGVVPYAPPSHLRSHHQCDTPPSRYSSKRKSPALGGSGGSMRRSPPPYAVSVAPSVFQSQIPPSRRSSPNFNTPNQQILPPVSRRSSPNIFNGPQPNMSSSSSSVLKRSPSFTNKSPRYRKSPVLSTSSSSTFKGTPSNNIKMSPPHSQSPKSCGPSPNSPPPKLSHSYSSPDISFSAKGSPDENMLPRSNCVSATGLGGMSSVGHSNGVGSLMCDICHKTFTSRSNLNKHKRVQHSGEEYRCQLCNRTFKNRYYIKEHLTICASANQKKAAAAAASGGGGDVGGGACSASSVMSSSPALSTAAISYSTMTAGTPPAHLSAAHPAPALAAPILHAVAAAPAPHDFFKYEPPDDEQPTDLAIHSRSSARQSNSPA